MKLSRPAVNLIVKQSLQMVRVTHKDFQEEIMQEAVARGLGYDSWVHLVKRTDASDPIDNEVRPKKLRSKINAAITDLLKEAAALQESAVPG
jgi:hypothetical protein